MCIGNLLFAVLLTGCAMINWVQRVSLGLSLLSARLVRTDVRRKTQSLADPAYTTAATHILTVKVQEAYGAVERAVSTARELILVPGSAPSSAVQLWPSYRTSLSLHFLIGKMRIMPWLVWLCALRASLRTKRLLV